MIRVKPDVKTGLRDERGKEERGNRNTRMMPAAEFHGNFVASHSCTFDYYCGSNNFR